MTNIQAPATEGNQTYNSYKKANVLDQTFIFEIPVYNNMPEYTSLPKSGDTNNNLASLVVENYELSPAFDEDILEYEVFVPLGLDKVNVSAVTSSSKATLSGTGEYELTEDETDITIIVTNEVSEEKKYIITIKKIDISLSVDDIISNAGLNKVENYITKINKKTLANTIKNSLISEGATKVIITNAEGIEIKDQDILATDYKLEITANEETKIYILSVKGDTSGDGEVTILDLLQVQKHIKGAKKLNSAARLSGDTSGDNEVTILDLLQIQKHIKGAKKL